MSTWPKRFTAGKWSLEMSDPWPSWITILFEGKPAGSEVHPSQADLLDLQYVVNRAVDVATRELK